MSISEDEAKERFKGMYQDDMREVYVLGRTAPPAAAEIEAVARKLLWWDREPAWEGDMPGEDFFWERAEPEMQANYLRDAREMLEIARKAANK